MAWILAVGGFGLCPFTCLAGGGLGPEVGIGILVAAALVANGRSEIRRERRLELREEFGAVNGWLVDLMVVQGAAPTGRDQGIVWFEDERLMFLGERTSFALSPRTTLGPLREASTVPGLRHAIVLILDRRTPAGRVALGFEPLPLYQDGYLLGQGDDAFRRALRGWMGNRTGEAGGLPPLAVGPDAPSSAALFAQALTVTAFWLALLGSCGWLGVATQDWGAVAAFALVLTLLALACPSTRAPYLHWRAWRDRLRIAKPKPLPQAEETA